MQANARDDGFICPHCGSELPADAHFCRQCGASDDSGWACADEGVGYDELGGYGEDDFDYEEFLSREFPQHCRPNPSHRLKRGILFLIVLALCAALALFAMGGWPG